MRAVWLLKNFKKPRFLNCFFFRTEQFRIGNEEKILKHLEFIRYGNRATPRTYIILNGTIFSHF